ncbi:MAG: SEC-C metal-binding domain-containing protein [Kofleriaceae bacterium]
MSETAPPDRERLLQVARALAEAASAPTRAAARRRLPVVAAADAAGLVAILHEQLDEAIERRAGDAAAAGLVIACGRGCNACCSTPVVVGEHEALAVARWLAQPERAQVRERFLARYSAWREALGALIEHVVEAPDEDERQRRGAAYRERHAMCPFNEAGDCTVYPVRPALCRKAHALGSSAACDEPDGELDTFAHPEVEALYEEQEGLRTVLHHALRPGRIGEALPKAVLRRLTASAAFPNQPCACGSGLKHRRCCGA